MHYMQLWDHSGKQYFSKVHRFEGEVKRVEYQEEEGLVVSEFVVLKAWRGVHLGFLGP